MATTGTTTYTSNASYSIKEDLSSVIKNIAPTDTPFLSAIGKGKATSTSHLWNKDTLQTPSTTGAVEGADPSGSAITMPTQLSNVTHITVRDFKLSGTAEAVDSVGPATKLKYQLPRHMKMLARDQEATLVNADYAAGNSTTARSLRGLIDWLDDTTYVDADQHYDFGTAYASTNLLTETRFNTQLQVAWENGGEANFALVSPGVKRTISGFNGSNKVTVNADQSAKKLINVVDIYESDFGTVKIVPERFYESDYDSSSAAYYDKCAILDTSLWRVDHLRPTKVEKLAKTGDSMPYMIVSEYTLAALEPKGHSLIEKIARS